MADRFRASGPLSLIVLHYDKPLPAIDALMPEHLAWLETGFAQGLFLVAGRQNPRTGGVILCRGDKARVAALAQTDPFVTQGAATASVIEFNASFAQPEFAGLLA